MNKKTVLITCGTGLLGHSFIKSLLQRFPEAEKVPADFLSCSASNTAWLTEEKLREIIQELETQLSTKH